MKHRFSLDGYGYKLRPAKPADIPQNLCLDLTEKDTCHFILESRIDKSIIAVFALICAQQNKASLKTLVFNDVTNACDEALYLLCKITFEELSTNDFCIDKTEENNVFTDKIKTELPQSENIVITKTNFDKALSPLLEKTSSEVFEVALTDAIGDLEFHHIGVATKSINKELAIYTLMGYKKEDDFFEDEAQGIRGLFIIKKGHPRLELLENLNDSTTLDKQLEHNQKLYHTAYYVNDIERVMDLFLLNRAKIISPLKKSVYFKKRICFLMLPNMSMIELLER